MAAASFVPHLSHTSPAILACASDIDACPWGPGDARIFLPSQIRRRMRPEMALYRRGRPAAETARAETPRGKTMKNQVLIQEVISQISQRFTTKIPEIKKAFDTLLEKECIEPVGGSNDTFANVM
ncbi:hypothetical protein B0H13DRAFT_2322920 [Mycena leptocephala]|nr:hypothetical protein B0H13DRAFT_2322920 [Mycena leptocephala]